MSRLDFRRIEPVQCAGLSISTFLSDDRTRILVSATDLVDNLGLNVDLDMIDGDTYVCYNRAGKQEEHFCILHTEINELLWMHDCSDMNIENLIEFRKYFMYEVIAFWNRFAPSAASLSVRDAVKLIDHKSNEYHGTLDIPAGRTFQFAFNALGYDSVPREEELTTEELAYTTFSKLLYASVAAAEQADGHSVQESMRIADERLARPLKELGYVTRGISGV